MDDLLTHYPRVTQAYPDEAYIDVAPAEFAAACRDLHSRLTSPVMTMFATDDSRAAGTFAILCGFLDAAGRRWVFVRLTLPADAPQFSSLSRDIFSATLFERRIHEMFGIVPQDAPDARRLHLHDEVWPEGCYPLRVDAVVSAFGPPTGRQYVFKSIEGEGVFEVPVGPVHAGVIGPGHFRFSAAGEPVVNLEARLGFTHRGVEKCMEGASITDGARLASRVSGKSAVAHTLAFCRAVEKISGVAVPPRAALVRCLLLELERVYNHLGTVGGIALDAAFSFPAAYAALLKEGILAVNEQIAGSRFLMDAVVPGGVAAHVTAEHCAPAAGLITRLEKDISVLRDILLSSASFMDRVETTGILTRRVAEDAGIVGLAARASGAGGDLRAVFPDHCAGLPVEPVFHASGDVAARMIARLDECVTSLALMRRCLDGITAAPAVNAAPFTARAGSALGCAEGARGPVLYWVRIRPDGTIGRCAVTDPSFHNWMAMPFVVPGNIIPDFPLCNKSFDLSYAGNDL